MTNEEVNTRKIIRNIFINWGGHGANVLIMFFLSPFIIHTIGTVQYGIWSLVTLLTGYMGVLDLGIRASTGRYVVLYIGQKDHEKVDQTIRTALGFFSLTGIIIILAGAGLGWIFPKVIASVPKEFHGLVKILLPMMGFNMMISVLIVIFSSVLTAHDRFDLSRGTEMVTLGVRTVSTIIALKLGYGLMGLALSLLASNLIGLLCTRIMAAKVYPRLRAMPLILSKDRMKELFHYGVFAFITAIAYKIVGQTSLFVIGWQIDVHSVTIYSVGAILLFYSSTMIGLISNAFFPPIQRAVARKDMASAKNLLFRQLRITLIVGLPIYIGYIVYGKMFIHLWMFGNEFPETAVESAAVVMNILSFSTLLILFKFATESVLNAMGYVGFTAGLGIFSAFTNLGLSLVFVILFKWGIVGVAAATLVARVVCNWVALPIYACQKLNIRLLKFLSETLGYGIFCGIFFYCSCYLIKFFFNSIEMSWGAFWCQVFLSLIAYLPLAIMILISVDDRKKIIIEINKLVSKATP